MLGNKEGFAFREQARETKRIDHRSEEPVWNHDQTVSHNIFAFNRDAQVWGWFDVRDERLWPTAMQTANAESPPSGHSTPQSALPPDVSLEQLQLNFGHNLYCLGPGQALFHWGVPWKKDKVYHNLAELQADLSFAEDSTVEQLRLKDSSAYDLRIPAHSRTWKWNATRGERSPG